MDEATAGGRRDVTRLGLTLFGVYSLALGAWMALAPGSFFDRVGPFGERNDHYTRDNSTWSLAVGAALLIAARRPSWRVPILFVVVAQALLHLVNHLIDIGDADPGWLGPFDAISIAVLGLLAAVLLRRAPDEAR